MIQASEAARIRRAHDAHARARKQFDPKRFKRGGGYTPAEMKEIDRIAGVPAPSNEQMSQLEVYEFVTKPPDKVFAYYNDDMTRIQTWTGDVLGTIVWRGQETRPMGGRVVRVRVHAINGHHYAGTCNRSSGTYCVLRRTKGS